MTNNSFTTDSLCSLLEHIHPGAHVVFDIDHTLIEPVQMLGKDSWEAYLTELYVKEGLPLEEAWKKANQLWIEVQKRTDIKVVDDQFEEVRKILKERELHLTGLTARSLFLHEMTFDQLQKVALHDFFHPLTEDVEFQLKVPSGYKNGILFCGDNDKGHVLEYFFKHIDHRPSKLIFIDDKEFHVKEVEKMARGLQIPFVGVNYIKSDKGIDPKICEIQLQHLDEILSDDQARKILAQRENACR